MTNERAARAGPIRRRVQGPNRRIALAAAAASVYTGAMISLVVILLALAVLLTVGALFGGLFAMARGGAFNAKWSNTFMRYRVLFQGIAVLIFVTLLALAKDG